MPSAVDATFPRDENGEAIPVLPHDFSSVVGGCVMLAGSSYVLTANAIYRLVGNTDLFFRYGPYATTVALTRAFGLNSVRLPADQVELIYTKNGQTSLSISSEYANGGCFQAIRMR